MLGSLQKTPCAEVYGQNDSGRRTWLNGWGEPSTRGPGRKPTGEPRCLQGTAERFQSATRPRGEIVDRLDAFFVRWRRFGPDFEHVLEGTSLESKVSVEISSTFLESLRKLSSSYSEGNRGRNPVFLNLKLIWREFPVARWTRQRVSTYERAASGTSNRRDRIVLSHRPRLAYSPYPCTPTRLYPRRLTVKLSLIPRVRARFIKASSSTTVRIPPE